MVGLTAFFVDQTDSGFTIFSLQEIKEPSKKSAPEICSVLYGATHYTDTIVIHIFFVTVLEI